MNVHLTPELEQLVQHKVKTGRYNSASEVVEPGNIRAKQRLETLRLMRSSSPSKSPQ